MGCNALTRRPRVLAILPGFIPSTQLHIVKPLVALHRAGWIEATIALEHSVFPHSLERAEVVVFCRNTEPAYGWILDFALARGKPVVYDLDDNFFELPPTTDIGRYHRAPERLEQLERYLKHAALVRVYSETLLERVGRLNPNAVKVDGPIDWNLIPSRPKRQDPNTIRIVYPTSRVEDELAKVFLDDVQRLLTVFDGRLEMFFWGYHPRELRGHPAVRFLPPIANYDRFFQKFARFGFDVGLAPLRDDLFHRSKTDVKFREYGACGIAGVYSNVGSYAKSVEHEVTGLLVSDRRGAWFDAVSRLVKDPDLRHVIQDRAQEYARAHYDLQLVQEIWGSQLQAVMLNGAGRSRSLAARDNGGSAGVPGDCQVAPDVTNGMPVAKQAWARWANRARKVIDAFRQNGLPGALDRIRPSLHSLSMLLRIRMNLQFWSIVRRMLPRGASRGRQGS
jgi:glycosyltransferase involved in cell wall biosynthesis